MIAFNPILRGTRIGLQVLLIGAAFAGYTVLAQELLANTHISFTVKTLPAIASDSTLSAEAQPVVEDKIEEATKNIEEVSQTMTIENSSATTQKNNTLSTINEIQSPALAPQTQDNSQKATTKPIQTASQTTTDTETITHSDPLQTSSQENTETAQNRQPTMSLFPELEKKTNYNSSSSLDSSLNSNLETAINTAITQ